MSKKHPLLKTIITTAAALYATNEAIDYHAKEKNVCSSDKGLFYDWKYGQIYYTVQGEGEPLLLIHNLDTISSNYEWFKIIKKLERNHTVYAIDLLGCGQSDKPSLTYTNYLYVQLITGFVKDVIGKKTDVITSADAAPITIMANHMDDTLFSKVVLINPVDIRDMKMETTQLQMAVKNILFMPLIGTSLYNFYVSESNIKNIFENQYFYQRNMDLSKYIDIYYQSAHIRKSRGRYLYASKKCCYTNVDITLGLKDKDNIYIIESSNRKHAVSIADAYSNLNQKIEVTYISNSKLLPMLEVPEQCLKIIQTYLNQ